VAVPSTMAGRVGERAGGESVSWSGEAGMAGAVSAEGPDELGHSVGAGGAGRVPVMCGGKCARMKVDFGKV